MLTMFHAVKGGSGTTVITALAALAHREPTLLIDLDDELPVALGIAPTGRPGVVDWLSSDAPLDHLDDLLIDIDATTKLLTTRRAVSDHPQRSELPVTSATRWMQLSSWCRSWATQSGGRVLIDCGIRSLPDEFAVACDDRWLVTRACYLSLLVAARHPYDATGTIVVREPGRTLTDRDIEASVQAPVVASIAWDPTIARSVDAGLLSTRRLHRPTLRQLHRLLSARHTADPAAA